jgi:hypothetical protein
LSLGDRAEKPMPTLGEKPEPVPLNGSKKKVSMRTGVMATDGYV